jgi:hypothetical protein
MTIPTFRKDKGNCECCGKPLGLSQNGIYLSIRFYPPKDPDSHKIFADLLITCPDCDAPFSYDIPLDRFFKEGPVHWMAHLTARDWFGRIGGNERRCCLR